MKKTKDDLTMKTKNVLGEEVEVYIGPTKKGGRAWEEKGNVEDCQSCPYCIGAEEAKKILKVVEEEKKKQSGFIPPPENFILGLCLRAYRPKILILPRKNVFKKCRYIRNG